MANVKISDMTPGSTLTGAELVELDQAGATKSTTTAAIRNAGVKVYRALLSQSGSGVPTATILENTIGSIVWTRPGSGQYLATLVGAFPASKVFVTCGSPCFESSGFTTGTQWTPITWQDANSLFLATYEIDGSGGDDILFGMPIEILVYP